MVAPDALVGCEEALLFPHAAQGLARLVQREEAGFDVGISEEFPKMFGEAAPEYAAVHEQHRLAEGRPEIDERPGGRGGGFRLFVRVHRFSFYSQPFMVQCDSMAA